MHRLVAAALLLLAMALPARAGELTVFAAASLTDVVAALKGDFERLHPGTTVRPAFAASGALLSRLDAGEACDVFLSADIDTMGAAVNRHRVEPGTRTVFAGNTLVLAVPVGNPGRVAGLDSLAMGGVRRIGIGNPESVPAGRYAKRALQQKALTFALASKLVYYPSVRHVLAALAQGELDAGFVYATDAAVAGKDVAVAATLPLSPPVAYAGAVAARAKDPRGAAAFLAFLVTPEARAILARFGFTAP
ncbi:molybdenum ABC transporter, periplasmic molybdate-binding protein [Solidesulfovibrio carbinoliphilus subsp. oakridgensis]|uniref:Molybdenum ABC transporter, periplasmic molybdate-binding protein n=1 Tax=Solidesulfovibrio carbinoliphilus subsp. oakridgensis TaxID=694327 RepID=G7QDX8_9BACT|nr:molybdate ABC transporter substrate-binding protein [Solidesulfovibrio carbinoliphilus]EHJ46634.1 molybdenum ABC transporter, periplasmic molybdate-binding protein [Solidesulfovibrio carbinoliphilus subsp. oakridgensis]